MKSKLGVARLGLLASIVGLSLTTACSSAEGYGSERVVLMQTDVQIPDTTELGVSNADWVGTWRGRIRGDTTRYGMVVILSEAGGALRGSVEYPELHCRGTWRQTGAQSSVRDFTEIITDDRGGECIKLAELELEHRGRSLFYKVTATPGWEEYPIRATLTRDG